MSGETEENVSGWTTDTLHTHLSKMLLLMQEQTDRRWADERRAVDIALRAHDEALRVAAVTSEKAIDAALNAQKEAVSVQAESLKQYDSKQNEWRGSLNDLGSRAMPRQEAEAAINRAIESIHEIRLAMQTMVTRAEFDAGLSRVTERLTDLTTRVTQAESAARGAHANKTALFAAMAAAVGLIGLIVVSANAIFR